MREYKWKPDLKNDDNSDVFSGYITLNIPSSKKRIELISELQLEIDSNGEAKSNKKEITQLDKMQQIAHEYVVGFHLVHIQSKTKIKSWEDIDYLSEYIPLVGKIANTILSGIKLGEIYAEPLESK